MIFNQTDKSDEISGDDAYRSFFADTLHSGQRTLPLAQDAVAVLQAGVAPVRLLAGLDEQGAVRARR